MVGGQIIWKVVSSKWRPNTDCSCKLGMMLDPFKYEDSIGSALFYTDRLYILQILLPLPLQQLQRCQHAADSVGLYDKKAAPFFYSFLKISIPSLFELVFHHRDMVIHVECQYFDLLHGFKSHQQHLLLRTIFWKQHLMGWFDILRERSFGWEFWPETRILEVKLPKANTRAKYEDWGGKCPISWRLIL